MKDFVPYELAVKLKEKGFDWETREVYERNIFACRYEEYSKPTISQVLKWLREEKGIFIQINYINKKSVGCKILKINTGGFFADWEWDTFKYADKNDLTGGTYESAALAGIEYVIDNLI